MQKTDSKESLGTPKETFLLEQLLCQLIETADSSFSLRYLSETDAKHWTEPMHSSRGAWSETLFVYEPALQESLNILKGHDLWAVASIGLGLGYNELLCAALALKAGKFPNQVRITSFESQNELRQAFIKAFLNGSASSELPPPFCHAQATMLNLICTYVGISEDSLKNYLNQLWAVNSLQICGPWIKGSSTSLIFNTKIYHCILFDAFSPDSSPDLWNEELLDELIEHLAAQFCIFASYASRNNLKKILKTKGFILQSSKGFAGKRERTFARRL